MDERELVCRCRAGDLSATAKAAVPRFDPKPSLAISLPRAVEQWVA
ncbi:MAG TPA: hypothetical protein VGK74_16990 [Symbiobacteriaceae bacterium]